MLKYSQLRKAPRLDLGAAVPLPAPLTVYLEPTNVCNFRCVMCPESFPDYQQLAGYYQRMPMPLYKKILGDLKALGGVKSLRFFFEGEPLLHPQLGEMIGLAKDAQVAERLELTTNASLLSDKRSLEIIDSGLDYLDVSVYATEAQSHREVTGSKFTPEQIRDNVLRLKQLRDERKSTTPFIYAHLMYDSPEGHTKFMESYTGVADELGVQYRHNWNGTVERGLVSISYAPVGHEEAFRFQKKVCTFPFYTIAIKSNGDVSPCCVDWNGQLKIGNLERQSLSEIWNGEELRALRVQHLAGERSKIPACANCTTLYSNPDNLDGLTTEEFLAREACPAGTIQVK